MLSGVGVDLLVGQLYRFLHTVREAAGGAVRIAGPGGAEMPEDQVHRHRAGDLAGGRAAHAVGHHEQRAARTDFVVANVGMEAGIAGAEIGNEEGVLVVLTAPAQVGFPEHGHADTGARHPTLRGARPLASPSALRRSPGTARVTREYPSCDPVGKSRV